MTRAGRNGTAPRPGTLADLRREVRRQASPAKARVLRRFFKTGPGEYGEGDVFLGLMVPASRALARRYRDLPLAAVRRLLRSRIHEERLIALLLLVDRFRRGDPAEQARIYDLYLRHTAHVNNWDLVDLSAEHIVGPHLAPRPRDPLDRLAGSRSVWERRIAVLATFHFIRRGEFADTLRIARRLLGDEHDLIHKAVGWMLREVGKRDRGVAARFLGRHARRMPRTMLRYAIERLPARERRALMER